KQLGAFDFFSFQSPTDVLAPHPDLFESELDRSLAAFDEQVQLQLLTVDSNDAFSFLRSDTPIGQGPPSTITVSSESAYESLSSRSESFYNYPNSPQYTASNYSFPLDNLDMSFQKFNVDNTSDYGAVSAAQLATLDALASLSSSPSPGSSPAAAPPSAFEGGIYDRRASYSDYEPSMQSALATTTASPKLPTVSAVSLLPPITNRAAVKEEQLDDPRKKYPCPTCSRSFARAYNLKTHMATHDPNRPKPHICPHRSCGRSFSRKHDLGRHLVSIHRDESACPPSHLRKSIGVDKAQRGWCDDCGKGWVGKEKGCDCSD
ncbi:hypothetical protein JAAARDRAFT_102683, partial [Jaapia argillacea MUCL 33604]